MDRDVYRPGESAHLKIVARELTEGSVDAVGNHGVVQCFDARSKRVLETNIMLGDLGSFDLTLPLPREPRGEYQLRYDSAGGEQIPTASPWRTMNRRHSKFTLGAKDVYGPDEPMEISVGGRYQFGKNLERATIRWYVNAVDIGTRSGGIRQGSNFGRQLTGDFAPVGSTS